MPFRSNSKDQHEIIMEDVMDYSGTYDFTSYFWKILHHPGRLMVQADGNRLTGTAKVLVLKAEIEEGELCGSRFSFVMRKKLFGRTIEMKVEGTFKEDGSMTAAMTAPFGTSHLKGHRI